MNTTANSVISIEHISPEYVTAPKVNLSRQNNVAWKAELDKAADRFHEIGAWVAIVFNAVFSLNDYFVIPDEWFRFFIFRISVSLVTLVALMLWKQLRFPSAWMIFVPYSLICVENAYIWSYMSVEDFRTHTLAYIAIYIGASMLIVWKYYYSIAIVLISIAANVVFLSLNSSLALDTIMTNGAILVGSVAVFSVLLLLARYRLTKKEIVARLKLAESNNLLTEQNEIIEENHRNITDSIRYAEKIQHSILPREESIRKHLPDSFVYFKPKDIVSGDFYWFTTSGDKIIIAAIDCTGHGVPGALMSMLGNSLLNRIVNDLGITEPAEILSELRIGVIASLKKNGTDSANGGMDMALCTIDKNEKVLKYAGAFNPLWFVRNGELQTIRASRMPIGRYMHKTTEPFEQHTIDLHDGDVFYIFSDGFQDQFGGPDDRKFSAKRFKALLRDIHDKPLTQQEKLLDNTFSSWIGKQEQIDDIVVIGFKV